MQMKSRFILSLFPALLAVAMFAGVNNAQAVEIGIGVGGGGYHHEYRHHEYNTVDPVYNTWYPDSGTTYDYGDGAYTGTTYVAPYVYATPSVEFGGWYGGGYRNGGGNFGGDRGGYSGGHSRGSSGGGGHSGGGHK